jgi:hypothetical protein
MSSISTASGSLPGEELGGEPNDGSHYYEHWLAALERLTAEKSLANRAEMLARKEAWADAYRHTAHGKPVELRRTAEHS